MGERCRGTSAIHTGFPVCPVPHGLCTGRSFSPGLVPGAMKVGRVGLIVIGNCISFFAALFMIASCIAKKKQAVFFCQFLECMLLAVASVFFSSFAGVTTLLLSAARNWIVAKDRYTRPLMYLFLVLTLVLGVLTNTRGLVGLLPVLATAEYTVCCHHIVGERATKCSIFVNILIWVVYAFLICDFSTAIGNSVVLVVDAAAIVRLTRIERAAHRQEAAG